MAIMASTESLARNPLNAGFRSLERLLSSEGFDLDTVGTPDFESFPDSQQRTRGLIVEAQEPEYCPKWLAALGCFQE